MSECVAERTLVSPQFLASAKSMDYNRAPIGDIRFNQVHLPGEPEEHGIRLRADVLENGFRREIIMMTRGGEPAVADGHHRAVLAVELDKECPAILVNCACPDEALLSNGRCVVADQHCEEQYLITKADGWTWH